MNAPIILIEGMAYRLKEDGRLETLKVGSAVIGEFQVTLPESRNMTGDQDHRIKESLKILNFLFPSGRKTAVQEKSMKGKAERTIPKLPRAQGIGAKSIYICNICLKSIITVDKATGQTWPKLPCKETPSCRGGMIPSLYTGKEKPGYEWRKPSDEEIMLAGEGSYEQEHYKSGGLILVKIGQEVEA